MPCATRMFARRHSGAAEHWPVTKAASYMGRTRPVNRLFPFVVTRLRFVRFGAYQSDSTRILRSPIKDRANSRSDLRNLGHSVDLGQLALRLVDLDQRGRLGVVGDQALLEGFRIIVRPAFGFKTFGNPLDKGVFVDLH